MKRSDLISKTQQTRAAHAPKGKAPAKSIAYAISCLPRAHRERARERKRKRETYIQTETDRQTDRHTETSD